MTPENDKMKPDAWLCDCGKSSQASLSCMFCGRSGPKKALYALTHPRIQALVDAATNYADMCNKAGIFADGDLRAALANLTHESSERKEGGK